MVIHKATIIRTTDKTSLQLNIGTETLEINLTEDKPNDVKIAFNKLVSHLKNGLFYFELEDKKMDLFFHICSEYISQLNSELNAIYNELKDYNLLNEVE